MDVVLDFLADNYTYFIIVSAILLVILIGLIAKEKALKKRDATALVSASAISQQGNNSNPTGYNPAAALDGPLSIENSNNQMGNNDNNTGGMLVIPDPSAETNTSSNEPTLIIPDPSQGQPASNEPTLIIPDPSQAAANSSIFEPAPEPMSTLEAELQPNPLQPTPEVNQMVEETMPATEQAPAQNMTATPDMSAQVTPDMSQMQAQYQPNMNQMQPQYQPDMNQMQTQYQPDMSQMQGQYQQGMVNQQMYAGQPMMYTQPMPQVMYTQAMPQQVMYTMPDGQQQYYDPNQNMNGQM